MTLIVRNSELSTYRQCRQKWEWAYVRGYRTKRPRSALDFGSLVHDTMERFYVPGIRRGGKPHLLWWDVWAEWLEAGNADWEIIKGVNASELGFVMLKGYWDEYGNDSQFKVIAPEQAFQLDILDPETGRELGTFVGQMDAVVFNRETKRFGLFEHKTGASLDPFGAPLIMDEQAGTYWTLGPMYLTHLGILKPGQELDFVLYNRLRKAMPDFRRRNEEGHCLNQNGTVSKNQPGPLFKREYTWRTDEDRKSVFRRIVAQMKEIERVRELDLDIYKNPDKHCGYCEFKDMCEVHEVNSDWEAIRDATMTTWDPYLAHKDELDDLQA